MKVLLTGASGFVGSHIVDSLRERDIPTAVLLRASSDKRLLAGHLPKLEVRTGSIEQPEDLLRALDGITHVIHCAGCTKARFPAEFYRVNHEGTRNVVDAVNARHKTIRRLVHISSLAVAGPATPAKPAREQDPPQPVSEYGKSKLAGELEVRSRCRVDYTIIRPPAVYGPRDRGFLSMFKAVKSHLLPQPSKHQALSLVFAKDLAQAVVACLEHPAASQKTYFAASPEIVTARTMAEEIAVQMKQWTIPFPLPAWALWPVCLGQELWSRLSGKAMLLNLQKFAELRAPGWVCDSTRLEHEIGLVCRTPLKIGIAETLEWYQKESWLA